MTSDSVASFRSLAQAQSILPPNHLDLLNEPEAPRENVAALCEFLHDRGALTSYQTEQIRNGTMSKLSFAGYPLQAKLGPCPGGWEYSALHPSLRTPVLIRQIRSEWVRPSESLLDYVSHAQSIAPLIHTNLTQLLDIGIVHDEAYIVVEPFEGASLSELVHDIGAMPTSLAVEYARHLATALQAIHERGWAHGELLPEHVRVGPLVPMSKPHADGTPRMRPAATATLKLFELGLVPTRPALREWIDSSHAEPATFHYLAPERVEVGTPTQPGDVYSLGAAFYFLLTGHAPFPNVEGYELLDAMRATTTPSLRELRPDVPDELVVLIEELMQSDPTQRPTAADVHARLLHLAKSNHHTHESTTTMQESQTDSGVDLGQSNNPVHVLREAEPEAKLPEWVSDNIPKQPAPTEAQFPMPTLQETWPMSAAEPTVAPATTPTLPMEAPAWKGPTNAVDDFTQPSDLTDSPRSKRPIEPEPASNLYLWLAVGAGLNIIALALLIYMLVG